MMVKEAPTPLVLAVDPGSVSGWSMYRPNDDGYVLHRYGLIRGTTAGKAARVIKRAIKARPDQGVPLRMVIERSYIPRENQSGSEKRLSSDAIEKLILNRARWQVMAELWTMEIELVPIKPQQWQTPIIGAGRGVKRKERKRRAVKVAESYFDGAKFVVDEADAVCMGLYECRLQVYPVLRAGHPVRGERL